MATQTEEAFDQMSCRRCGRFAGPELLCPDCDDDLTAERRLDAEAPEWAAEGGAEADADYEQQQEAEAWEWAAEGERAAQSAWLHRYDTGGDGLLGYPTH